MPSVLGFLIDDRNLDLSPPLSSRLGIHGSSDPVADRRPEP